MKKNLIYAIIFVAGALFSCNKSDNDVAFSQYLYHRIQEAERLLAETVEGNSEGEYKTGAHAFLQSSIDAGLELYWNASRSQKQVDDLYDKLAEDITLFGDKMNPFVSDMTNLITQSNFVLTNTEVGDGDGKIPSPNDKVELQAAITDAESFMSGMTDALTQRQLDTQVSKLTNALYLFEGKIPGAVSINVVNHSFEEPATIGRCIDFTQINGWNYNGWIDGINPWTSLNNKAVGTYRSADAWWVKGNDVRTIPHGERFLNLFMYAKPVWQLLGEGLHPSCKYTVSLKVARFSKSVALIPTGFRMQLVVFNGTLGDFNKTTVLGELKLDNISGINDFTDKSMVLNVSSAHDMIGKRMAITLMAYYKSPFLSTNDPNFIWSPNENVGAVVDMVTLVREKAN